MSESSTYHVQVAAGEFYIRILAAERKSYYSGGRSREEIQPRAQISTDPEFKADTNLGAVKIRGRKYAVEHVLKRVQGFRNDEPHIYWHGETSYQGGYRNDKGRQVSQEAQAWDVLHAAERDAVEFFAVINPDWERESTRLLFERERDNHLHRKRQAELEADQEDIKAAQWQKRIEDLIGA
ncbi:hypothetical protein [Streptomyces sp. NPDC021969]|uniref:hypothetical protein n=1 Tax=unclassified Streptomyces TaxID=2593676 RepID=UPI0034041CA2